MVALAKGIGHESNWNSMRRAILVTSALLCLVASMAGCKQESGAVPFRVRDRQYRHVVSLSPSTTELVASTLGVTQLSGRTEACNFPTYVTQKTPVVASVKPDYEKLRAVNPDFIVLDSSLYSPQDIEKIKAIGATTFIFSPKNLDQFSDQLYGLANYLGGSSKASEYLAKIEAEQSSAAAASVDPKKKVAIMMSGGNGNFYILGSESPFADVVRAAACEPIGPKSDKFVPLSPEMLVEQNPDVIIVSASDKKDAKGAEAILKDARFKNVKAIKEGHVRAIVADVLLRMGSRVDTLINRISMIARAN